MIFFGPKYRLAIHIHYRIARGVYKRVAQTLNIISVHSHVEVTLGYIVDRILEGTKRISMHPQSVFSRPINQKCRITGNTCFGVFVVINIVAIQRVFFHRVYHLNIPKRLTVVFYFIIKNGISDYCFSIFMGYFRSVEQHHLFCCRIVPTFF